MPLFWISGDVSSGFQSQSRLPYSHCGGKRNVHSPRSTSGATIADLLTVSIVGCQPGSYLAQGYYCVAAVSLKPAINTSWVLRTNHAATRPGLGGGIGFFLLRHLCTHSGHLMTFSASFKAKMGKESYMHLTKAYILDILQNSSPVRHLLTWLKSPSIAH